jgi:membrane protein implicated in regulation of membrane protease activity
MRFVQGSAPVGIVVGLLFLGVTVQLAFWPAVIVGIVVLWLGRRWLAGTMVTRCAGIALAVAVGPVPALAAFFANLTLSLILMPAFLLLLPLLLWDLFVRQPHKGRFARARAERRGTLQE